MDFLVVTPDDGAMPTGNRGTADRWAEHLRALGHGVSIRHAYEGEDVDAIIALNAAKTAPAIAAFGAAHPDRPLVVVLTGTDVYPELGAVALESLRRADRIVGLQSKVRGRIPAEYHDRLRIIIQSADAIPASNGEAFDVSVVGHLREIKDPLRAAAAARLLPAESRIRVRQAGALRDASYGPLVEREQAENPRYQWLGELSPEEALRLIAASRVVVVSSFHEGGARAIGEAAVAGTPVLAARNDAAESLLGEGYPGLYDAGDTEQLAALMARAESDAEFLETLRALVRERAAQFDAGRERDSLRDLVAELKDR